jgi:hypothetical protein
MGLHRRHDYSHRLGVSRHLELHSPQHTMRIAVAHGTLEIFSSPFFYLIEPDNFNLSKTVHVYLSYDRDSVAGYDQRASRNSATSA